MFSSTVLDLATGLVFCFLTASLASGIVVEAISSITKWRAKTLRDGIGQLLNDPQLSGLAGQLYSHAAINPRGPGNADPEKNRPAYIDRQLFAHAMMDLTGISFQVAAAAGASPGARPSLAALHDQVRAKLAEMNVQDPQLNILLRGIIDRSFGDAEKIQTELSTWFDHAMDRVSGVYKRWTQLVGFIAALVLAVTLNIDAVHVATVLWEQPKLVDQLKLPAAPATTGTSAASTAATAAPITSGTPTAPGKDAKGEPQPDVKDLLQQMNTTLPVGWPRGFWVDAQGNCLSWPGFLIPLLGWLITAFSTLFGAPFWFDLLQQIVRLKGAGPSPQEKVAGKGASA